MTLKKWTVLQSRYVLRNRWIQVRQDTCQLPNGKMIDDYFVLEDADVGCVFALTPDRKLILVEQYKHALGGTFLELPAGGFENPNGDPLEEARREFREETGYDAAEYRYVGKMGQSPTRLTSYFHLFLALDAYPSGPQHLDPSEDITVRLMPLDEVFAMIARGDIHVMSTVACIYLAASKLPG
jgi:8-oxo-dGTP pyrophosphatase MutT (NUDIX family)